MKTLIKFLSTGFFAGYIPFAPGTMGTIVGAFLYWYLLPDNNILYFLIILTAIALGVHICGKAENIFEKKDDQRIVLDEIIGIWVSMLWLPRSAAVLLSGIILFRFFDILKPFFIRKVQAWKGGIGVVADDIFAGLLTNIVLWVFLILKNR